MKICKGIIVCLLLAGMPQTCAKAEQGHEVYLDKIIITNRRTATSLGEATENIEVLDEGQIENLPVSTLSDALSYIPAVGIEPRQGLGKASSISIQGSVSRQIRVMIDGIPLNSQVLTHVNPAVLPVEDIDRIEVIKGAASSMWGSALGGVVNVITKDTGKTLVPKGSFTTSFAGFKTQKENFDVSGKAGRVGYYLFSSYMESGGRGPKDDVLEKKAFTKLSYDLKEAGSIIVSFGYSAAQVNSGEYPADSVFRFQEQPYRVRYGKIGWEGDWADSEIKVDLKHSRQEYITKSFLSLFDDAPASRVEARDRAYQLSMNSATHLRGKDLLVLGADFDCDTIKSTYLLKAKNVKLQAPYANYTLKLEPWDFNLGLRYDRNSEFGDQTSPAVGVVYHFSNFPETSARVNISHAFNAPPLIWKYYEENLSGITTNPDIKPERAWVYETGLESKPIDKIWIKFSLYRSDVSDAINLTQNGLGQYYMKNFEKFRRQGVELESNINIIKGLYFDVAAAFNDVEDRATGQTVRGGVGPRQSFNVGIEYKNENGFKSSLIGYYNRWNNPPDTQPNDRKMLADAKISQQIKNTTLFLSVHNLTNSKYWSDYFFPLPERYFEGGFTLKW